MVKSQNNLTLDFKGSGIIFSGGGVIESVKIKAKDCITVSLKGDLVYKNTIFEANNVSMLSTKPSSYALLTDSHLNSNIGGTP